MMQAFPCGILALLLAAQAPRPDPLRDLIHRWVADRQAIERFHDLPVSDQRDQVLGAFYGDWIKRLRSLDYDALGPDDRIDYQLLAGEIEYRIREIAEERRERERILPLLPFAAQILTLEETRRRMEPMDGQRAAGWVSEAQREVKRIRSLVEKALEPGGGSRPESCETRPSGHRLPIDPESAWLAADRVRELRRVLESWHANQAAFDPVIAWWVNTPYEALLGALDDYATFLRQKVAKATGDESDPLFGRPIGREALVSALRHELIAYTPEELIEIGKHHAAWCVSEMKMAAADMKLGDDWKRALEKVKRGHVGPGEQPDLVEEQAKDAIAFCDRLELVTIPPLCRELWRLDMISGAHQKTMPFASYGGLGMNVAFPTADMDPERKLMSMRGNNRHFSRLVTPHELIPGHHLQSFMAAREKPWRREFSTPFFVEGWAVYGEMLFYKLGFAKSPEDRIGAILWRLHRCARIVVSLRYHLGDMTPDEMVTYLVDEVGLERDGATAEVRRYLRGGYGPLYQCGYLVGALQLWRLREELDVGRKVTERAFHDALLSQGPIPIELVRAALTGTPLPRDFAAGWRFEK
jgi:uncharacterized protein (DUF885 family)